MDIFSEQKSQYKPYSEDIVIKARPPMVKKPNNLFLTGEIELFPEYRTSYVPYNLESVFEFNKPSCGHYKIQDKINGNTTKMRRGSNHKSENLKQDRERALEAKTLNNNYGVSYPYRYHQKADDENNFEPEYRSKFQPVIGQRSSMIPQRNNLHNEQGTHFDGSSEYKNRYKTYDQFTKSAPIKKQDNLQIHKIKNQTQAEYTERYKEVDMNSFERRMPYRREDNLHTHQGDFPHDKPEYCEKYRHPHASSYPERAKAREDFLALEGDMEYSPEYRKNYVEFPRQRPIVRRPPSNVQMPVTMERDRKKEKVVDLPIDVPYHSSNSASRFSRRGSEDSDEIPLEMRPEYRKAMRYNMIKERSPSRNGSHASGSSNEKMKSPPSDKDKSNNNNNTKVSKVTIKENNKENDASKIQKKTSPIVKEKMFNENNEVIVEPLRPPENFKLPTRSPEKQTLGKPPSYPIERGKFNEENSNFAKKRTERRTKPMKVTIDQFDPNECTLSDDEPAPPRKEFIDPNYFPPQTFQTNYQQQQAISKKKSPKFGRRATNPVENYHLRTKTSVIEANPRYAHERRKDIVPNCHERSAYYHQANQNHQMIPQARPPADSLATNYYPNYEIDREHNYRESLRDERNPFVVIDNRQIREKPNTWMKKSWYDTQ